MEPQLPSTERGVLGLPLLSQSLDRARLQPRAVLAEQIPQGPTEVAGREAVQVQDRENLGHLRRSAGVRRQDLRAEPLALPSLLIVALVVDPRRADRHVPEPTVTRRSCARPLRTTSRFPSSPTSSTSEPTYSSTSASSAAAIICRAPSPARSSSVTRPSSSSPTRACEHLTRPAFLSRLRAVGLDQPGRYAAFLITRIHNFWI